MKKLHWILGSLVATTAFIAHAEPDSLGYDSPLGKGEYVLPRLTKDSHEMEKHLRDTFRKLKAKNDLSDAEIDDLLKRVVHYLGFLGLTVADVQKEKLTMLDPPAAEDGEPGVAVRSMSADPESGAGEESSASMAGTLTRLARSSTQVLFCEDLNDWTCLEKKPRFIPTAPYRVETRDDLGEPVRARGPFRIKWFFTNLWDRQNVDFSRQTTLASHAAEAIRHYGRRSMSMALFGIDDIGGSMAPVYDAIKEAVDKGVGVRAVVDFMGVEKSDTPWNLSYLPSEPFKNWLFGPGETGSGMRAIFQYDGTPDLLRMLNGKATKESEARARMEWPGSNIMHNKFVVMDGLNGKAVWTGTANLSKNCMGIERNANMGILIENREIAEAFEAEFEEMYNIDSTLKLRSSKVVDPQGGPPKVGRFHRNKRPNTKRLFEFGDGTNVRVHFAPTDDAEHRVILPLILSARPGDVLRVSMFGGAGFEIVRAFQLAAARGVDVRIAFDAKLGASPYSWTRASAANLNEKNPYVDLVKRPPGVKPGRIEVRFSTWEGKNHHKSALLTRRTSLGQMRSEVIVIGSQNWSTGGNDANDENMVSIQNRRRSLPIFEAFLKHFDERLWAKSRSR